MFDLAKIFGSYNARNVKKYEKTVKIINGFEDNMLKLSDEELRQKTIEFKELLAQGKELNDILPEAFAVVREASKRVLDMRHFDVQLIGGMVLHDGRIAEMRTGEGKTLVATLAVYLNALPGKGVHVVTVNDYLAKRDADWMGRIYQFLGLTVDISVGGMGDYQKKKAYNCDITYGTNHEFGFDYLRDNLKFYEDEMVMRPFNFCVIDEVDSILIDEARTPLIISGADQGSTQLYITVNDVVKNIKEGDFEKDEKSRIVTLTDSGVEKIEKGLKELGLLDDGHLYDSENISIVYHVNCALKAHILFCKDVDYIVKNKQIMIIDEFTGRIMDGRRYSEGLHQALEAKENVEVKAESQTVATISYQNLFRLYPKISGMTGTAITEEAEFDEIYKLKVVSIPPNRPVARIDYEDSIFLTAEEKYRAVLALTKACVAKRQPILIGTTNIDRSEFVSDLLKKEGIKHSVLNARHHKQEAHIIAEAGAPGAVTIATNMAGRGTDIKLGGSREMRIEAECANIENEEEKAKKIQEIEADIKEKYKFVSEAGGLFVVGTERNESRRIDNQLRGRSSRQGDPGASKYFLSMEDDLIRRFGAPNFAKTLQKMGVQKDEDLTHRWISKAIEKAQQRVEAYNFDIRKQLLRFDDVMNDQRKVVYTQRMMLMKEKTVSDSVKEIITCTIERFTSEIAPEGTVPDQWDGDAIVSFLKKVFDIDIIADDILVDQSLTRELLTNNIESMVYSKYEQIVGKCGRDTVNYLEKEALLKTLDKSWRKHLIALEHLRRGINLRAYAQKNPLNEYKIEAFTLFASMMESYHQKSLSKIFRFNLDMGSFGSGSESEPAPIFENPTDLYNFASYENDSVEGENREQPTILPTFLSRNSLCSCGSGKKYKYCCGALSPRIIEDFPTNTLLNSDRSNKSS
jgi:preprotein translocase subunit SecA